MAQKTTTDKERKEKEQIRKKEYSPLIQVDKHGDPISIFIDNFKRQFRKTEGLINWSRLFGSKRTKQQKQPTEAGIIAEYLTFGCQMLPLATTLGNPISMPYTFEI